MKKHLPWILALSVSAGGAAALAWTWQSRVVPEMLLHANEEMLADWKSAMEGFRAENGRWPADPETQAPLFFDEIYIRRNPDGTRIDGGWLHGNPVNTIHPLTFDAWWRPLKHEFSADHYVCRSAGLDGVWGTPDDMSSDNAKAIHTEDPEEGRKPGRKKAKKPAAPAEPVPPSPDAPVP